MSAQIADMYLYFALNLYHLFFKKLGVQSCLMSHVVQLLVIPQFDEIQKAENTIATFELNNLLKT